MCCVLRPVSSFSGVGETEDGAELHVQDEVEDEQRLFAQRARDIILLKRKRHSLPVPILLLSSLKVVEQLLPSDPGGNQSGPV